MAVGRVLSVMITGTGRKELGADFKLHYMDVSVFPNYIAVWKNEIETSLKGAFEIPKTEMDRYITIFQPPTGDELV